MAHQEGDSKRRNERLRIFVRMLKTSQFPNCKTLKEALDRAGVGDNFVRQTLYRDVEYLKSLGAEISYDHREHNGYCLENPNWSGLMSLLDADEMEAAALGAQFAEQILPPSALRDKIRASVDFLWAGNSMSDEDAYVNRNSLVIQKLPVNIDPNVFQTIFLQWRSQHLVEIVHTSSSRGKPKTMTIEPHVLTYCNGTWYTRARVVAYGTTKTEKNYFLTFALHRISAAKAKGECFEKGVDMEELKAVHQGKIFDFPVFHDVKLRVKDKALRLAQETFPLKETKYTQPECAEVTLEDIEGFKVVNFVLVSAGEAEILEPQALRAEAYQKALATAKCLE